MISNATDWNSTTAEFTDLEKQMDKALSSRREGIERELSEKIAREREEAQKRIAATEHEFTGVKTVLDEHKAAMAEIDAARQRIEGQLHERYARAVAGRKSVEDMAAQSRDDWEKIGHLRQELEGLRTRTEEKAADLAKLLAEKFGIQTHIPVSFQMPEFDGDWDLELLKMKKIGELLGIGRPKPAEPAEPYRAAAVEPEPAPDPEPAPAPAPAAEPAPEPELRSAGHSFRIEDLVEEAMTQGGGLEAEPESMPEMLSDEPLGSSLGSLHEEERPEPPVRENLDALIGSLQRYIRTEPVVNGTEITFYQGDGDAVIDGESLISTINRLAERAKALHVDLKKKESVKEVFLVKQDILNQQELLRKLFFQTVKFCEKGAGVMPEFMKGILSVAYLKDMLERLTMGNWSNPIDFGIFTQDVDDLNHAFETRIAARGEYFRSILDQVEGRLHASRN